MRRNLLLRPVVRGSVCLSHVSWDRSTSFDISRKASVPLCGSWDRSLREARKHPWQSCIHRIKIMGPATPQPPPGAISHPHPSFPHIQPRIRDPSRRKRTLLSNRSRAARAQRLSRRKLPRRIFTPDYLHYPWGLWIQARQWTPLGLPGCKCRPRPSQPIEPRWSGRDGPLRIPWTGGPIGKRTVARLVLESV